MAETQYWRTEQKRIKSHGKEQCHIFQTILPDDLQWGSFDRFLPHAEVHYVDKPINCVKRKKTNKNSTFFC